MVLLGRGSPVAGAATAAVRSPDKSGRSYGGRVDADQRGFEPRLRPEL